MESIGKLYQSLLVKYRLEVVFAGISILAALGSLYFVMIPSANTPSESPSLIQDTSPPKKTEGKMIVDIEGAVKKPGAYSVIFGARLKDILDMVGGLSEEVDKDNFDRQFNLAQKLTDEEKIFIPSLGESRTSASDTGNLSNPDNPTNDSSGKVNINTATKDELDKLPSIGSVTADKIIQGRPYSTSDDLLNHKIVSQSTYDKIKKLITAI